MIVFTNGCFDILHKGHVELLEYAYDVSIENYPHGAGILIVGLNSDKSIKKLKGKDRPINNQNDRKYLLESIKWVDEVIIFGEQTPYNLIKKVKPDVIVKGGDYDGSVTDKNDPKYVVGSDLATVKIFNTIAGYSTTNTLARM